ncbi:MAG: folate-binding protein YgfZ [Pararhodobacter sp.]|nr:folate-binding protein YgfZ [Pararhodobacter sp.]
MTETRLATAQGPADTAPVLESTARCAPLPGRAILAITGPDRLTFLQGLVTNDVRRLADSGIIYAAMLTPQGKFLADFFLVAAPDAIWLDTDAALADDLRKRLTLYTLRSKVEITPVALPVTGGIGPIPAGALADPRHPEMGWRLYGTEIEQGAPIDWDARRVAACVPETGSELVPGDSFILEFGFERLGGVDFRKGCYVGQEVTARMHHKTELRKGLAVVAIEGVAEAGCEITTPEGRAAGMLGTVAGDRGLAWLRFDRATGEMIAGPARLRMIGKPD